MRLYGTNGTGFNQPIRHGDVYRNEFGDINGLQIQGSDICASH